MTAACKICQSADLTLFAHTAKCRTCGVLLNFPYLPPREEHHLAKSETAEERADIQGRVLDWYLTSGSRNHHNFTHMAEFALTDRDRRSPLALLDFGGGGGQFALVARSLFPLTTTYVVDMVNSALLPHFEPLNRQIRFEAFERDDTRFDVIFMNDVYEHVSDPIETLKLLRSKLKPNGRIFIDTPCQFWLYPATKMFSKGIHTKLLKGTVDHDHQQIWTRTSFMKSAAQAGLKVDKFERLSEYTQGASFYMNNMGIRNPAIRLAGRIFFALAPYIARNKIMAVLSSR